MKRKYPQLSRMFGPVKLYQEDIDSILDMLRVPGMEGTKVGIETSTAEYDSLDEVASAEGTQLSSIDIWRISDCSRIIRLSVDRRLTSITTLSATPELEGVFYRLVKYVAPKQRFYRFRTKLNYFLMFSAFLVPMIGELTKLNKLYAWVFHRFSYFILFIILLNLSALFFGRSEVMLFRKAEAPSFWPRNKDKIAVEVIKVAVGALIGAGLTFLVQWIVKQSP